MIASRLEDSLYVSVKLFVTDLEEMLLSPPKYPDFAIIIPEDLPVSPSSRPPQFTGIIPEENLEINPLGKKIMDAIQPMIQEAYEAEPSLVTNMQSSADYMQTTWKAIQDEMAELADPVPALSYEFNFSPKQHHAPRNGTAQEHAARGLSPQSSGISAYHTPESTHAEQPLGETEWDTNNHFGGAVQQLLEYPEDRWLGSDIGRENSPLSEPDEETFARIPPAKPFEVSNPSPPETRINGDGNEVEMDGVETELAAEEPLPMELDPPYPLSPPIGSPSEQLKEQLYLEMTPQTNGHAEPEPENIMTENVEAKNIEVENAEAENTEAANMAAESTAVENTGVDNNGAENMEVENNEKNDIDPQLFNIDAADDDDSPLSSPVPSPSTPPEAEVTPSIPTESPRKNAKRGATATPKGTPKKKATTRSSRSKR